MCEQRLLDQGCVRIARHIVKQCFVVHADWAPMVIHPGDSQPIREVRRRSLKTFIQFFGFALLRFYHFAILHSCFLIVSSCSRFQRCVTLRLREFTFPPFHNHKVSELSIFMSSLSLELYGVLDFANAFGKKLCGYSTLSKTVGSVQNYFV